MKILYPLAKRFIAGHNFDSAKPKIEKLIEEGYEVSVDYLGEVSETVAQCEKAKQQYIEIINYYKTNKINISIKPSQLGILIDPLFCRENLLFLAELAKLRGHTIRLDMEDARITEATINLAIYLNDKFQNVGVALQANLHRTNKDIHHLIKHGVSVRLVKGAYKENCDIAFQSDHAIEGWFFDYAARLYSEKANKPAIATHDEELIEDIHELITDSKYYDYELLYGIRRDLQKDLKDKGYKVRIYVPFGKDWMPYCARRLKEFKNLKFVIRNVIKEWFK